MNCCELLRINGLVTHEFGCTEKWRDETRKCRVCGIAFRPASRHDGYCSNSCCAIEHLGFDPEESDKDF